MTLTKYWSKNQCTIRYKTDIFEYNEYWYNDTKDILKSYQFVVIDAITFSSETTDDEIVELLTEFNRLMTIENRIVIYDNEEIIKYLEQLEDWEYYDNYIDKLNEIIDLSGFDCIWVDYHSYLYKDVYLYTNSRLGVEVFNTIMEFYGYDEDDY